jgi:hypothetical protein
MTSLIDEFNRFFSDDALLLLDGDTLQVTIQGKTMLISLPTVRGWQGTIRAESPAA